MQLSYDNAKRYGAVPIFSDKNKTVLLCKNFLNKDTKNALTKNSHEQVEFVCDKKYNFAKEFEEYYSMVRLDDELKKDLDVSLVLGAKIFFEHILSISLKLKSSDIHIYDDSSTCSIKLRINGQLRTYATIDKQNAGSLIRIIKLNCGLDISRTVAPIEGRFTYEDTDCRVSIIPTVYGEKINIRILGNTKDIYDFNDIGMDNFQIKTVKKYLSKNSGLILLTGPTGSGKSTTLFAMMHHLNNGEKNIISIEDPVEYKLSGVTQIQISQNKSIEFENILKFVLRQDPDIINIGEIRDDITAKLAVRAANTGHLVLSTMHTGSSVSAISRLMDLSIEPYEIVSSLRLVISQRLIRVLCPDCKVQYTSNEDIANLGIKSGEKYYKKSYCTKCYGTGYSEQKAIFEMLEVTDEVKKLIGENMLNQESVSIKTLRDYLLEMLKKGETSVEEVYRYI